MKKLILLASATLAFGGVAVAQDATPPATGMATPDAAAQPNGASDIGAQPGSATDPSGGQAAPAEATIPPAAGGDSTMPATGAPAPDASGGATNGGSGMAPGMATGPNGPVSTTPTQGATDLPMCSKTVTDNCKQGAGKSSGMHHAARHHRKK